MQNFPCPGLARLPPFAFYKRTVTICRDQRTDPLPARSLRSLAVLPEGPLTRIFDPPPEKFWLRAGTHGIELRNGMSSNNNKHYGLSAAKTRQIRIQNVHY